MIADIASRLVATAERVRPALVRAKPLLLAIAAVLFLGGAAISIANLELGWNDLVLPQLALLVLVLAPLSLLYGACNMIVMSRGAGIIMSLRDAWRIACFAQLAEFLPLPGGALVRGGALMKYGASTSGAASHVIINAMLWVACGAVAAGIALAQFSTIGMLIGAAGLIGVVLCCWWLWRKAGSGIALASLGMRVIGLMITGLRIGTAFQTLGTALSLIAVYPFAFAAILGSASSLAPGGLGISEALAAGFATLTTVVPAAAFVAVGLNRVVGLLVSGTLTGTILLMDSSASRTNG